MEELISQIEVKKPQNSRGRIANCPTQAKTGLEWATRWLALPEE
jgi:hypothetical protein